MNQHTVNRLQESVADLEQQVTNYTVNFYSSYLFFSAEKNVMQILAGMVCNHTCCHPHMPGLSWGVAVDCTPYQYKYGICLQWSHAWQKH